MLGMRLGVRMYDPFFGGVFTITRKKLRVISFKPTRYIRLSFDSQWIHRYFLNHLVLPALQYIPYAWPFQRDEREGEICNTETETHLGYQASIIVPGPMQVIKRYVSLQVTTTTSKRNM